MKNPLYTEAAININVTMTPTHLLLVITLNKITKIQGKKAAKVYHIIIFTHFVFVVLRLTLLFHVVQHEE